ncbi:hypothetical protein D3C71_153850 [compost metagenome]
MTHAQRGARTYAPDTTPPKGLALKVEPRRRYDPDTGKYRRSTWAGLSDDAAQFLMRDGRPAENIRSVIMTGQGRDYRFRRDIAWKDFPHIQRPIHDYGRAYIADFRMVDGRILSYPHFNFWDKDLGYGRQNTVGRKTSRASLAADLGRIEEILVISDPWDDKLVWEAVAPVFTINPNVVVWHRTFYEDPRRLDPGELQRLELKFRAHDHFVYNYTYNMIVLSSRARFAAARLGPGAADLASAGYHLFHEEHEDRGMDPSASFSPFAIEALQAIAATSDVTVPAMEAQDVGKKWREPFSRLPFMACGENGEVFLNWTGSGKFKPWIEKLTQIHNPPVYDGAAVSDHLNDLASLCSDGLATFSNDHVVPTNTGRAFLDIIGDSVRDPDILLRWRQSGDAIAGEGDFPAVDRWLASKFRRLKRKVAALPSSPLTEAGQHWRTRERNKLVIRGHRIDAAEWSLQERKAIAGTIRSSNEGVPLHEQAMGVITTDDPFEAEDVPVAFWIGKCLGVVPANRGHAWQYNCNLDTTSIDGSLVDTERLPVELRRHEALTKAPGFVTTGTEYDEDAFITLPQHLTSTRGGHLVPVYYGKAVFPDDMARWRQNRIIQEIEGHRSVIVDRDHPADLDDPIRLVWRYGPDAPNKEQGFLVGMRVGFGTMNPGTKTTPLSCSAVLHVPEDSWEMPVTGLADDSLIADDLNRVEPSLWCGVNRPMRRVTAIRKDGSDVTLELDVNDIKHPHPFL